MKSRSIVFTSIVILWCVAVQAVVVDVDGGLVVCIDADALESVSNDWKKLGCVFQCLETSESKVSSLRERIMAAGCHGKVSVARFDGKKLPYINNLANLLIMGSGFNVPSSELKRVLAPYGVAVINGKKMAKPYPEEMDEWPQYLHGADNNCVAQDTVVGPPRLRAISTTRMVCLPPIPHTRKQSPDSQSNCEKLSTKRSQLLVEHLNFGLLCGRRILLIPDGYNIS